MKVLKEFVFSMPGRVVFGMGVSRDLSDLVRNQNGEARVLLVTDQVIGKTEGFAAIIDGLEKKGIQTAVYDQAVPEPSVEAADRAAAAMKESGCGMAVAVGGGSVIDCAKVMCMLCTNEGSVRDYLFGGSRSITKRPLPLICIATTAGSGSEVTASSVISDPEKGIKLSVTHEWLIPLSAVVDPLIHKDMPALITASTGMDALTHAIEAFVSRKAEPLSDAFALSAIRLIAANIRTAVYEPDCMEARSGMALASLMAASAFVNGGLGAVHGISQAMGGVAHVSHGVGNALLLPFVCEANLPGSMERYAQIASLLGEKTEGLPLYQAADCCVRALHRMLRDLRLPKTLREVKVTREMFPKIIQGSLEYRLMPLNPVPLKETDILAILEQAY